MRVKGAEDAFAGRAGRERWDFNLDEAYGQPVLYASLDGALRYGTGVFITEDFIKTHGGLDPAIRSMVSGRLDEQGA